MRSFQENIAKLEATDTQVLSVSMDSPAGQLADPLDAHPLSLSLF